MRKLCYLLTAGLLSGGTLAAQVDAGLLRYPDVSATQIVFTYANDIWVVAKTGGVAQKLSSPPGVESFPKFSPDGKSYDALATSGEEVWSNLSYLSISQNKAAIVRKNNEADGVSDDVDKTGNGSSPSPQLRTNFNETAFFFPQVYADTAGNYNIAFTMPESLTKWKWLSLAHTKALSFGVGVQSIITQKTLMVQPGMPRFLREGDKLELTARISNLGDTALTGQAALELLDAATGNPVDGLFQNVFPNQYFTAEAGQTTVLKFPVVVPVNFYHPTQELVQKLFYQKQHQSSHHHLHRTHILTCM